MNSPDPYIALALQIRTRSVNGLGVEDARASINSSIVEVAERVRGSRMFISMFSGTHVRLAVFPEYFLSSYPAGESIAEWQEKACLRPGGPEYEALGKLAQDNGLYFSGNAYEIDEYFPELYFQTSFLIDDSGDVVLRYRRLISMFAPTPHDVLDAYLDRYGAEALFPVADTNLGRIACVASEEILYPEITRAMALRGAELICHSSSEVGSTKMTPKNVAKRARAYENMCYVVSANSGGIAGISLPQDSTDGHSQVVDYKGEVLAEAAFGESLNGHALVDMGALRSARRKPGMTNTLSRQRTDLCERAYQGQAIHPANQLLAGGKVQVPERAWFNQNQASIIEELAKKGII